MKKIALADDHTLLRKGVANLVQNFGYAVVLESDNGRELTESIAKGNIPDLVLLDINMPEKDGYETSLWLKENYPDIKVLALSMYDDETAIIRMLKMVSGAIYSRMLNLQSSEPPLNLFLIKDSIILRW